MVFRLFVSLLIFSWPLRVFTQPAVVSIAAASDLVFCLEELNVTFSKAHPEVKIEVTTGSSGNFYAQIRHGAPFDVFLSADILYPRALARAGLADSTTLTMYAIGRIVLWVLRQDIDLKQGLAAVSSTKIRRFAIAHPDHAPYGRAARAALETSKLWDKVQSRLVFGENIAQTAQFVQTGNADAGIVALSLVKSPQLAGKGRYIEIPESLYPRLEQGAVITRAGIQNPAARTYLAFLRSERARHVFDRYGFRLPQPAMTR